MDSDLTAKQQDKLHLELTELKKHYSAEDLHYTAARKMINHRFNMLARGRHQVLRPGQPTQMLQARDALEEILKDEGGYKDLAQAVIHKKEPRAPPAKLPMSALSEASFHHHSFQASGQGGECFLLFD